MPFRAGKVAGNKEVVWLNRVWWQVTAGLPVEITFSFALTHSHVHERESGEKKESGVKERKKNL